VFLLPSLRIEFHPFLTMPFNLIPAILGGRRRLRLRDRRVEFVVPLAAAAAPVASRTRPRAGADAVAVVVISPVVVLEADSDMTKLQHWTNVGMFCSSVSCEMTTKWMSRYLQMLSCVGTPLTQYSIHLRWYELHVSTREGIDQRIQNEKKCIGSSQHDR
jgi:hypothetical protein